MYFEYSFIHLCVDVHFSVLPYHRYIAFCLYGVPYTISNCYFFFHLQFRYDMPSVTILKPL